MCAGIRSASTAGLSTTAMQPTRALILYSHLRTAPRFNVLQEPCLRSFGSVSAFWSRPSHSRLVGCNAAAGDAAAAGGPVPLPGPPQGPAPSSPAASTSDSQNLKHSHPTPAAPAPAASLEPASAASGAGVSTSTSASTSAASTNSSIDSSATTNGSSGGGAAPSAVSTVVGWLRKLVTEQYLPLMLLAALVAAALQPSWGLAASKTQLQTAVTFTIFVLQGVMLRQGEAKKALGAAGAIAWGMASILLITPLLAPLAGALPLQPPGLALGLLVFGCMPTTLSSGVALTQVLGGNTALALLLTIATNLASVFTLPFLLPWALKTTASIGGFGAAAAVAGGSAAAAVRLDPVPLLVQLVQCILLPTLLGAGVRGASEGLRSWVDANRRTLSVISGGLLSLVPWMQVSKALAQGVTVAPAALAAAVAWSLAFHVVYLGLNCGAATLLRLGGSDPVAAAATRRALIIVASQKTLPVAMAVLGRLAPAVGAEAAGCAAVTAVFSHLAQTCVDFALVSRWLEHIQRRDIKANKAA
ncbi:hypothetical protein CHLRE_09g395700v5 [Chlamydomonas reinhardtii]|uniref:Uncharacterized protein n=1 Tax=Chlamydomonas reinhardtii TaxID=3055 RepID=A0A2K3DD72_CHLRE|nr:uncharacterized protein CHLRE_09g395700v5 [Chlamydomonas reinhardtii]PNW78481.1 hypothetical protein CHLRE_09g395700v5 [Chlamydomonas reinhardtii]